MALLHEAMGPRVGVRSLSASADVEAPAESTFALLCRVEKWPVWLTLVRSAELRETGETLDVGSELVLRSVIPGEAEEVYEVAHIISNHRLALVGAYSCRRRLEFRIEQKTARCRVNVRVDYPAYGGKIGSLVDQMKAGRKLGTMLDESMLQFKGLAEFGNRSDGILADF